MTDYGNLPTQPLVVLRDLPDYGSLPTQPLPVLPGRGTADAGESDRGLVRSGRHVVVAGVVGRVTGFARTIALAAILGTAAVGDAFNGANTLPNMVYELLLGSVFASALLPVLTRARHHDRSRSPMFTQRLIVAALLASAALTAVAVVCAPLAVRVFVADAAQRRLATTFAYLLLPQIFWYAATVLLGAVLNVRDRFGAAAWAPVVNNVIALATCGVFVLLPGPVTLTPTSMTTAQILTLGIGTTAGIAGQAVWVAVALRRTGFRWSRRVRPLPYTWRPVRIALPMMGWLLAYAAISQIGVVVTTRVAFDHHGVSVFNYADLLFQVPYGILAASLLTVLMPRISRAAAAGDRAAMIADLGRGARYLTVALVPMSMGLALLGPVVAAVVFTGRVDGESARLIGATVAASSFGLAPYAVVLLQMRIFYADNDTRTPTLINVVMVATKLVVVAAGVAVLPAHLVVVALGVAASMSYLAGAVTGHVLLRGRYGLLGFSAVAATFTRVIWATVAGGAACAAVMAVAAHTVGAATLGRVLVLIVGAAAGAGGFLLAARAIGIPEVRHTRTLLTV
ncbi:MviN-like membrane protein [Nocardia nova SH22a]|uniref:MviN-like membrane protein n=1 Tax=Nocardia nova SH22a TaxID=1415166 RepID=W5TNK4_9NOCA|nr:lipid II flippase MurJ [Nocardia nova]AHH18821.1 MviN-like membrane protein [Nocardia nova SH22a]